MGCPYLRPLPEGLKYSMQYGTTDGETIIRYDNSPDHPNAAHHHKHRSDTRSGYPH
jgi:hypothetical protein